MRTVYLGEGLSIEFAFEIWVLDVVALYGCPLKLRPTQSYPHDVLPAEHGQRNFTSSSFCSELVRRLGVGRES